MATNKNQMSIISEEDIKKALKGFKLSYRDNIEKYEKENVKVEDVVTLSLKDSLERVLFLQQLLFFL